MVLRHEHQHDETMLQTLQLARLGGYEPPDAGAAAGAPTPRLTGLELIEVPAGRVHDRRPEPAASPTTTSAPATAPTCAAT